MGVLSVEPLFLDLDSTYGAARLGLVNRYTTGEGVTSSTGLAVSQRGAGANMSVDVAPGQAFVFGDEDTDAQPGYLCVLTSTDNNTITAADATNERLDLVVLEVDDDDFDSSGQQRGRIHVVAGTPAATPSLPAVPNNAIPLAQVSVPATDTSIEDAQITDLRQPYSTDPQRTGMVDYFPLGSTPWGYVPADGTAVNRIRYARLFALYSTTIGSGDGSTTFGIPNLEDRSPIGAGNTYSVRATGGATTHTLSASEMPSHTHTGPSHTHSFSDSFTTSNNGIPSMNIATAGGGAQCGYGSGGTFARSATAITDQNADPIFTQNGGGSHAHTGSVSGTTGASGTGNTGSAGSGGSHNNLHPYYALTPFIRV